MEIDFDPVFESFYPYKPLIDHQKYANNYDYNKALDRLAASHTALTLLTREAVLHYPPPLLTFSPPNPIGGVKDNS